MTEPLPNARRAYRAFISYSHADKAWADWLHRALETYRVPSRLVGTETAHGKIPRRLNPVFRDRDELASAAELGRKINEALAQSENLIVICSPASAASRWVNEEVLAYKRFGRGERIFCLIVAGEPNATDVPGRAAEECFCPALRFATDADDRPMAEHAEPIAADARPGKDGRANAKLKLIAGMLGVGFDEVKQREQRRQLRRMAVVTALAVAVMAVTLVLAVFALVSRHDAVIAQQAAQRRQKQAEGLVDFMLGDLSDKLQAESHLDILTGVDDKAMAYFKSLPPTDVNETALVQRAVALEHIGYTRMYQGQLPGALEAFRASTAISSRLAAAAPSNAARQVAYSRTLAFIGMVHYQQAKLADAQRDFATAQRVLQLPLQRTPADLDLLQQLSYVDADIGHVLESRGQLAVAEEAYQDFLTVSERLVAADPKEDVYRVNLGPAHALLGELAVQRGDLAYAIAQYRAADATMTRLSAQFPKVKQDRKFMLNQRAALGSALLLIGDSKEGVLDLQHAVAIAGQLRKTDSGNANFQDYLGAYASQLARALRVTGDLASARAATAMALEIFPALIKKDPSNQDWQNEYASVLVEQAAELRMAGDVDGARSKVQAALRVLAPALARHPDLRGTLLITLGAKLLLASVADEPDSARTLRAQVLEATRAVKVGRGDPRLLALEAEALLALDRSADAQPLVKQLWTQGYRDPGFVDALRRAHIGYPPNPAFQAKLHAATARAAESAVTLHAVATGNR